METQAFDTGWGSRMPDLATGMQMAVTVTEVHLRPPFKKEPAIQLQKAVS